MRTPAFLAVWCLAWFPSNFANGEWLAAALLLALALFYVAAIERLEFL